MTRRQNSEGGQAGNSNFANGAKKKVFDGKALLSGHLQSAEKLLTQDNPEHQNTSLKRQIKKTRTLLCNEYFFFNQ